LTGAWRDLGRWLGNRRSRSRASGSSGGHGRRRGKAAAQRRRAAAQRPHGAGVHLLLRGLHQGCRARACKLNRASRGDGRRREAAHGGQRRRWRSGEGEPAMRSTSNQTSITRRPLTLRQRHGDSCSTTGDDGGAGQRRRVGKDGGGADELGLGAADAGHGIGRRRGRRRLR
jgi:hypothetical protein